MRNIDAGAATGVTLIESRRPAGYSREQVTVTGTDVMGLACVELLARRLARHGKQYELLGPLGAARARVRFVGDFLGNEIIWDATLVTLQQLYRERAQATGWRKGRTLRPFIEISEYTPQGLALRIALAVSAIDEPTVLKTIVMIRNYKRLRRGRHEFGQALRFPDE